MFGEIVKNVVGYFIPSAQAASVITVPTDFATNLTGSIGDTITDPGIMMILALTVGLPLAIWVLKQLISLIPKNRGHK